MVAELALIAAAVLAVGLITMIAFRFGVVLSVFVVFLWIAIVALHVAEIGRGLGGGRLRVPGVSGFADRL
jgi:hypothetical protein